eukprot:988106_1
MRQIRAIVREQQDEKLEEEMSINKHDFEDPKVFGYEPFSAVFHAMSTFPMLVFSKIIRLFAKYFWRPKWQESLLNGGIAFVAMFAASICKARATTYSLGIKEKSTRKPSVFKYMVFYSIHTIVNVSVHYGLMGLTEKITGNKQYIRKPNLIQFLVGDIISSAVAYPLETVFKRAMFENEDSNSKFLPLLHMIKKNYKKYGFRALWDGFSCELIRINLRALIMWS